MNSQSLYHNVLYGVHKGAFNYVLGTELYPTNFIDLLMKKSSRAHP